MASACSRIAQRTITSFKSSAASSSFFRSAFAKSSTPRSFILTRRNTIGFLHSMLPLHTAVASATMTSCLATNSTTFPAPLFYSISLELGLSVMWPARRD